VSFLAIKVVGGSGPDSERRCGRAAGAPPRPRVAVGPEGRC
jgi:hypothetical protein